jgi:hypothetical protein
VNTRHSCFDYIAEHHIKETIDVKDRFQERGSCALRLVTCRVGVALTLNLTALSYSMNRNIE